MLRHISPLLSPELLKVLAEMGHGDTIVLADANYPAMSGAAPHKVRADGIPLPALLDAILRHFPVDTYVPQPVTLMQVVPGDDYVPEIWRDYFEVFHRHGIQDAQVGHVERMAYYRQAETAYAVVASGERSRYANIILKKGVID